MKKLLGLTFQVTKEEGDKFSSNNIMNFVTESLESCASKCKLNLADLQTKIFIGSQKKEQEEIRSMQNYYQKLYKEKTFFKNNESDDYYGNLEHFIFGGKLASGKGLSFNFKEGEDIAIIYITFIAEDNKTEPSVRKIGLELDAQYFKMPIQ